MARPRIALIGAGQIGGTLAHLIGLKELGDFHYISRCQSERSDDETEALRSEAVPTRHQPTAGAAQRAHGEQGGARRQTVSELAGRLGR